jgi:hypothetical protein
VVKDCATSREVPESIPGGVTGEIFSVAPDGTMCPGVDSASENFSWGKGGRCVRLTTYHPFSAERLENPEP